MEKVINIEKKEPKMKKSRIGRIFTIVIGVFVGLLLIMQISGSISAQSNYGVQRFGDYQVLVVITDSMEPSIKVGEGVFVKRTPLNEIKASTTIEAKDGDILTFFRPTDGVIVTHRVVEVLPQSDGSFDFETLGDNLNAKTCPAGGCNPDIHRDYVEGKYVLGKVVGQSYAFGQVFKVTSNPIAIAVVAVVPLLYVFISSVIDVVKHSKMKDEEFEVGDLSQFDEFVALKQREKLRLLIEIEKDKLRKDRALIANDNESEKRGNNEGEK